jgi:hypothetical protein
MAGQKVLNEICHDHPATAVQMNTVGVKAPAIHLGDLVGTLFQHKNAKGVMIERKKSKAREGTTRRRQDLPKQRFVDGNIADNLFSCDLLDDCAVFLDAPVEFTLERVCRGRIFSDRRQRAEPDGGRGLSFQAMRHCPKVLPSVHCVGRRRCKAPLSLQAIGATKLRKWRDQRPSENRLGGQAL